MLQAYEANLVVNMIVENRSTIALNLTVEGNLADVKVEAYTSLRGLNPI